MHFNKLNTPLLLYLHILLATLLLRNSNDNNNCNTGGNAATAQQTTVNSGVANLMQVNFEQALAAKLAEEEKIFSSSSSSASASGPAPATSSSLLLSRKRRYLLFPEGSSFQLVWDGIFGVVDYVNYLILGITVALAWELPSKAPSEMIEDIRIQLQEGTLGQPVASGPSRRNDTINNISYVDTTKLKTSSSTGKKPTYINLSQNQTNPSVSRYNYYYKNKYLMPAFHAPMHQSYYRPYSYPNNKYSELSAQWNRNRGKNGVVTGNNGGGHYYYPAGKKNWQRKDDYYYSKNVNPFGKWSKVKTDGYGYTPAGSKYPWWNLATRLSNSLRGIPRPTATSSRRVLDRNNSSNNDNRKPAAATVKDQKQHRKTGNYQSDAAVRKHHIYPVFGKRSISDQQLKSINLGAVAANASSLPTATPQNSNKIMSHHRQRRSGVDSLELSKLDRIHIRHHRHTRQTLYEKIEKYLDKRGLNGQHCVLRTLCETGQKSHEHSPGSFVGELMRTVFTLPEVLEEHERKQHDERRFEQPEVLHHRQRRYDEANAFVGDCAERYQLCKDSLWASEFVM